MRLLPLLLLCACQTVPIEFCSEDFRDTWWLIDPKVTDSRGGKSDVCMYVGTDGYIDVETSADEVFGPYEWECKAPDEYRVKRQGTFSAVPGKADETWRMDAKYHGLLKENALLTPCWFMGEDYE